MVVEESWGYSLMLGSAEDCGSLPILVLASARLLATGSLNFEFGGFSGADSADEPAEPELFSGVSSPAPWSSFAWVLSSPSFRCSSFVVVDAAVLSGEVLKESLGVAIVVAVVSVALDLRVAVSEISSGSTFERGEDCRADSDSGVMGTASTSLLSVFLLRFLAVTSNEGGRWPVSERVRSLLLVDDAMDGGVEEFRLLNFALSLLARSPIAGRDKP